MSKCDSAVHYRWLDSFESFGGLHDSRCHCWRAEENEWVINLECFNPGESTCAIVGLRKTMEPKNFDWRLTGRHYSISSTPHQSDSICGQTAFPKQTPSIPFAVHKFWKLTGRFTVFLHIPERDIVSACRDSDWLFNGYNCRSEQVQLRLLNCFPEPFLG